MLTGGPRISCSQIHSGISKLTAHADVAPMSSNTAPKSQVINDSYYKLDKSITKEEQSPGTLHRGRTVIAVTTGRGS